MARPGTPGRMPRSPAVLLLPILSVVVGIVAVLLAGTVRPAPASPSSGSSGGELLNAVTYQDAGLLIVALFGLLLAFWVLQRLKGGVQTMPAQFLIVAVAIFCVALAFLVAVHLFVHAVVPPRSPTGTPAPLPNSTAYAPSYANNSTGNASAYVPLPSGWPSWVPYVALAAVGLVVGALAVPYAWARSRSQGPGATLPQPAPLPPASAVRSALETLDGSDDPRQAIIAMYGQLLASVGHRFEAVESRTARELERQLVDGLGVSLDVTRELTERFEEARYSIRPLVPEAVARTRQALTQALEELARPRTGP